MNMSTSKAISNPVDSSRPVPTRNITVEVSGSRFCIVPSLFKHIENLPWKERKNKPPKLYTNPDLFEYVLQYFLSSKLPEPTNLSPRKAKTLIEFVSPLDPVAVKPLVDYLQTFVEKSPTDNNKTSFVRRGLTTISTPFSPFIKREKSSKTTTSINAKSAAKQSASHASASKAKESNKLDKAKHNPTDSGTSAPISSSIPSTIEPATITDISVCSMDESSMSIQSSPSLVTKQQPAAQNENVVPVSATSSVASTQNQSQFQHYHQQNRLTFEGANTQYSGSSVHNDLKPENPFDNIPSVYSPKPTENPFDTAYKSAFPTMVQSLETNFNNQYRQPIAGEARDPVPVPFTQTHNLMTNSENQMQNHSNVPSKSRATAKILRTVLGGNEKKYSGIPGSNSGRYLFRKSEAKMTHVEWCASASEYIV